MSKWKKTKTNFDLESGNRSSNIPFQRILVTDGNRVFYVEEHGWDKGEYYFHDGTGKVDEVTHFMLLPHPPKKD